jgi:hypothetical protein
MAEISKKEDAITPEESWPGFISVELPEISELIGPETYESQIQLMKDMDPTGDNRRRILGRASLDY